MCDALGSISSWGVYGGLTYIFARGAIKHPKIFGTVIMFQLVNVVCNVHSIQSNKSDRLDTESISEPQN